MRHFNVSLIVQAKSQDGVHKPQILKNRKKESRSGSNRGPSAHQPSALPLGHTGSSLRVPLKYTAKLSDLTVHPPRGKVTYLLTYLLFWCFEPSQPLGIKSGLKETFIKRYVVERTNEAELRPQEQSEKMESCRENLWNEIQLKGP